MTILIENGAYELANVGDVAMLEVCVRRLRTMFPSARLQVVCREQSRLDQFFPDCEAVVLPERRPIPRLLPAKLQPAETAPIDARLESWEDALHHYAARPVHCYLKWKLRNSPTAIEPADAVRQAVERADAVVASGGGYITDDFVDPAERVLTTLRDANRVGIPTAVFSQGLGPFNRGKLLTLARQTFRRTRLIALRESLKGPAMLRDWGVPDQRITVTGDDAIELSAEHRPARVGDALGVNIRLTKYSGLGHQVADDVRRVLERCRQQLNPSQLMPLPIAAYDYQPLLDMLRVDPCPDLAFDRPSALAQRVAQVRAVVTGAYHAAVFALAQGVPAVAMCNSIYYAGKFGGLNDMFGGGLTIVPADQPDLASRLYSAIEQAWNTPENERQRLRRRADEQIERSRAAYFRFRRLV